MGVALKINKFGGMLPAVDARLIPDDYAVQAQNTYFYKGKLQGINQAKFIRNLVDPSAVVAYRVPNANPAIAYVTNSTWLEFDNINTDVLRPALIEDQFQRYYWASSNAQPMYNTLARIQAASNPLLLGVTRPSIAPGVSLTGGSSGIIVSRAYTYTWVTAYGEEGQPATPTVNTGQTDATWNITLTPPAANDTNGTNRVIATANIYRTITGVNGVTTFFFVASVPIATTAYADTATDATIAANNPLPSTNWSGPPSNLQGWVAMPNGMIAGWENNNIWFCEPYRPHAWPTIYQVSVDYPIVGLGVSGQTLVICTEVSPYWGYGINPSSFALSKIQAVEPCLARGSILSAPEGVYYASPNGLILIQAGGVQNISRQYMLKDAWLNLAQIGSLRCARLGTGYYAWGTAQSGVFDSGSFNTSGAFSSQDLSGARQGLLIDPVDTRIAVTQLSNQNPTFNTMNDLWTGEVFLIRNGAVYWINLADTDPTSEVYTWTSKLFQAPNKKNLGAMKIYFDVSDTLPVLNPVPNTNLIQTLAANQWGLVSLYADQQLVWTREIRVSGEVMRLPSGFKADFYQLVIQARVAISNIQVAESVKELART